MIDHVSIGVADLSGAVRFYDVVLGPLGLSRLVTRERTIGYGKRYPEFWLNHRPAAVPAADPGSHVCLRAPDEQAVSRFHALALEHAGTDEGPPGLRAAALTDYFGAFIRDADGNRIEAVTFPRGGGVGAKRPAA